MSPYHNQSLCAGHHRTRPIPDISPALHVGCMRNAEGELVPQTRVCRHGRPLRVHMCTYCTFVHKRCRNQRTLQYVPQHLASTAGRAWEQEAATDGSCMHGVKAVCMYFMLRNWKCDAETPSLGLIMHYEWKSRVRDLLHPILGENCFLGASAG